MLSLHIPGIKKLDPYILLPAMYLCATGLTVQTSIANKANGVALDLSIPTQMIAMALGFASFFLVYLFKPMGKPWFIRSLYFGSVLLLIGVILIGVEANGSQRWINLAGIQIQPTEIAKLGLILFLARLFDTRDATVNRFKTILTSLVVTAIPAALIVLQPDLGSGIVLFVIWIAVLFTARLKLSRFALVIVMLLGATIVMVPFMAEYQQERLVSYFNPEKDESGSSYNVLQAGIAIGSGGLLGNGIDSGTQSQLNFLPSQHTDFIFAVTAEKLGLVGAMSVIVAFLMIIMRITYLAWVTSNQYERGILAGISAMLFFHAFVNIGMNLGIVPVTGLPLPLMSYGGTFSFVVLFCLGITSWVSYSIKQRAFAKLPD